jgi:hypothetical protein
MNRTNPPGRTLSSAGEEVIVDDEVPALEARIERFVIAEGDVGNGHVVESVGQFRFLEGLMPDVGVGIKCLGQAGGDGINLDAGDAASGVHRRRA